MKWIGQHIWDYISRFRNDVYLEDISTGTIVSGGNLGLDANNKIVKADTEAGELAFSGSTANGILTYGGAAQIDVESTLTYQGASSGSHLLQSPVISGSNSLINAYVLDVNAAYTGGHTVQGFNIDYDKSAVTAGSNVLNIKGLTVDLNDAATNEAGTSHNYWGIINNLTHANAQGTIIQHGIRQSLNGGDEQYGIRNDCAGATAGTTYGLHQTIIDGGYDLYFRSSADTSDYFALQTGANGETTLTTVDAGGTGGHFNLNADGQINLDASGEISIDINDGDYVNFRNNGISNNTFARFYAEDGATTMLEMYEAGGTSANDSLQINVLEHGQTTILTSDASGSNAHISMQPDGNLTFMPSTGDTAFISSTSAKPLVTLKSTHTDKQKSAELKFLKDASNVEDDEALGEISFYGDNDAGTPEVIQYGRILGTAADMTDGAEAGELSFSVAEYDGNLTVGLKLDGDTDADGEVDVTIGAGAASTTTIAGTLTMGTTAAMTNGGLLSVANQSNITGLGTISSGTWQGNVIADAYVASNLTISSGTINNSVIGGSTPAAITGTTIDANTDFTVGTTVITDDQIQFTPSTSDTVTIAAATNGALNITTVDNAATSGDLTFTVDGKITMTPANINGTVFHLDANANTDNKVDIDAGQLDIDAGAVTLDALSFGFTCTGDSIIGYDAIEMTGGGIDMNLSSAISMNSSSSGQPLVKLKSTNTTKTTSSELRFIKDAADVEDEEVLGQVSFYGDDHAGAQAKHADITVKVNDTDAGNYSLAEMNFNILNHNQGGVSYNTGLKLFGKSNNNRDIDVNIASGVDSLTTIAGDLTVTSQASMPQRLFAIPSDGAGNVDGDIVYIGTGSTIAGKIYYYKSDGSWGLTNSSDPSTATGWLAVALGTDPDIDGMLVRGMVDLVGNIVGTEALGSIIYLDKATGGDATTAAPTATGDIVRIIGYAVSTGDANKIWFSPDNTWVEHV